MHNSIEKEILEGFVAGKRSRGRQRKKWSDGVEEVIGMSTSEVGRVAQDRKAFRETVDAATL